MRRLLPIWALLMVTACGSVVDEVSTGTPDQVTPDPFSEQPAAGGEAEAYSEPTLTVAPQVEAAPTAAPAAAADDDGSAAYVPAQTLTAAAEVRIDDWVKGAVDNPLIVIVEYGDFQ